MPRRHSSPSGYVDDAAETEDRIDHETPQSHLGALEFALKQVVGQDLGVVRSLKKLSKPSRNNSGVAILYISAIGSRISPSST
jgi:hypothetical protein